MFQDKTVNVPDGVSNLGISLNVSNQRLINPRDVKTMTNVAQNQVPYYIKSNNENIMQSNSNNKYHDNRDVLNQGEGEMIAYDGNGSRHSFKLSHPQ